MNRTGGDFFQWMRRALPFGRALIWRLALLYFFPALYLIFVILFHLFFAGAEHQGLDFFGHHIVLVWYAAVYGIYRAAHRHPIYDPGYHNWMRTVPWTPERPLPFRLDGLGGQDLLIAGLLMALGRDGSSVMPWWILSEFFCAYTLATLWTLACMKAWRTLYGLLWGASFPLLLISHPPALALGLAVLTAAVTFAERHARRRYRWHDPVPATGKGMDEARMTLGLPADYETGLASVIGRPWFGLAVGLLGGWWVWLATRMGAGSGFYREDSPFVLMIFSGIILTAIRMLLYFSFAAPPLSFFGRMVTGRLIIPGFDRVMLAPLAVCAAIIWTGTAMSNPPWGISSAMVLALGVGAMLACALGLGPTLRHWALTGHYRARIGARPMVNNLTPASLQNTYRSMVEARQRPRTRGGPVKLKPEPFLMMTLPWPGSRDRHARMITWLTLATTAAFAVVISGTLLPELGWFFLWLNIPCIAFLVLSFLFYAVTRAFLFHPFFRPEYRAWLKSTPWRPGMALPLGPPGLAWRDGLYLGVYLALLGALLAAQTMQARAEDSRYDPGFRWALIGSGIVAFVFLAAYGYGKLRLFFTLGECGLTLALGTLLGAVALLLPRPAWAIPGAAAVLGVCAWGDRRVLRRFPWEGEGEADQPRDLLSIILNGKTSPLLAGADEAKVGWLNAALSPRPTPPPLSGRERLVVILLPAWWIIAGAQVIARIVPEGQEGPHAHLRLAVGQLGYLMPTLLALFYRLIIYLRYARPPLSLWGRIVTGRLIIPGFDRVFLTPLAVLVSMIAQTVLIIRTGAPGEWFAGAWIVSWSILLLGGPSLRNWRLTAECRLATEPPALQKGNLRAINQNRS